MLIPAAGARQRPAPSSAPEASTGSRPAGSGHTRPDWPARRAASRAAATDFAATSANVLFSEPPQLDHETPR